jgi:hypothetical protein
VAITHTKGDEVMSPENLSRRAILAGAAASPTLAVPAIATAGTGIAGPDQELRRLWFEYSALVAADEAVEAKYTPGHAAFDAESPPCPEDVSPGRHFRDCQGLWRKHGLDELSSERNSIDTAMRDKIAVILNTKAEGLYGIAVKLSALPDCAREDTEDWKETTAVVLEDIDRLLGSDFGARFCEICDPSDLNRTWEREEDEAEEREAVQS